MTGPSRLVSGPPLRRHRLLVLGLAFAAVVCVEPVRSQPTIAPEYVLRTWTVDDGLPVNGVNALVRGPGGYLWLATFDGIARFDGSKFSVFTAATHPELPSNRFQFAFNGPQDELWFVTEQGDVVSYANRRFTHFDVLGGMPLAHLHTDHTSSDSSLIFTAQIGVARYRHGDDTLRITTGFGFVPNVAEASAGGGLWVGGPQGRLIYVDDAGSLHHTAPDTALEYDAKFLHEDRQGVLWVLTSENLLRRGAAGFVTVKEETGAPWRPGDFSRMEEDDSGRLWITDADRIVNRPGLWIVADDVIRPVAADTISTLTAIPAKLRGPDGHVWTFDHTALYRDGRRILETGDHIINMILPDPDGSVWLVTDKSGLIQVQPTPIRTYGAEIGLPGVNLYPVLADQHDNIWVGTMSEGLGCYGDSCPMVRTPSLAIFALHQEDDGTLWAGGAGVYRLIEGRFASVEFPGTGRVRALYKSTDGILWVGTEEGLFVGRNRPDGSWQFRRYTTESGLTHNWVRLLTETRDGTMWAGTNGGGLMRIHRNAPSADAIRFEAFTEREGLCSNNVRHLYEDEDGVLWIASEDRGVCRIEWQAGGPSAGARITEIGQHTGLFDNALHYVIEDASNRLWMSSNRGLFWVSRGILNEYAAGVRSSVFSNA